jgi:hypothetical protein
LDARCHRRGHGGIVDCVNVGSDERPESFTALEEWSQAAGHGVCSEQLHDLADGQGQDPGGRRPI